MFNVNKIKLDKLKSLILSNDQKMCQSQRILTGWVLFNNLKTNLKSFQWFTCTQFKLIYIFSAYCSYMV